jgi:predicted lipid-binding transport protein (Tim44 family)
MQKFGKLLLGVLAVTLTFAMTSGVAEAGRFGGGKSVGMSRNNTAMRQATPPAKPAQNAAPASTPTSAAAPAAASGMSRWMGPIAGLAAGIGLAAMLSHFGMGEGAANFMMIALLAIGAVFLFRWLMRKREPVQVMQYAGGEPAAAPPARLQSAHFEPVPGINSRVGVARNDHSAIESLVEPARDTEKVFTSIPAGFDVAGFIRQAKINFVRLQAANDRGDLDDIRQFTAPEVFAEIQMQIQERGSAAQQTDVVQLEAELLGVDTEETRYVASVRYFGELRENANGMPQSFEEIWHLTKPTDGSRGWQIAGIQQLS